SHWLAAVAPPHKNPSGILIRVLLSWLRGLAGAPLLFLGGSDKSKCPKNRCKAEAAGHGDLSDTPLEYTGPPCKVKRERMRKGSHQAAGAARRHRARRSEEVPVSTKLNELSNDNRRPVAA